MRRKQAVQLELRARTWGGKRKGGGRPRTTGWVSRKARPEFPKRFPLHITLRVRRDVGNLRNDKCFAAIQRAFLWGHEQFGMRMVEFSVQADHIHLVVEADGKESLRRGMQGLNIRLAKAINRALDRRGKVFADRYHAHILKTPTEVRNVVNYVRCNYAKHLKKRGKMPHPWDIDPYSSMSGRAINYVYSYDESALVVAAPQTWLLRRAVATAPS
jgi:REP-associated tyrosine transposase